MTTEAPTDELLRGFADYPPVLTTADVAQMLAMSVQEIRRLTREGQLPARRIGKAYRYFRDEIVAWLDTQVPS
jgi:PTS system nitrogen regulatory IIA component